jgi:glycosyltransferase involved in cell wall biosynthesis
MDSFSIEVVVPVHDEQETIGRTISEFLATGDSRALGVQILVAEDGSSDGTRAVVAEIVEGSHGRVRLTPPSPRKGYSRAIADACRITESEVLVFCDGDGQYVPEDLPKLLDALSAGSVVAGARSPRRDSRPRMLASGAFGLVYRLLIGVRMDDPSSPFVAAFRSDILRFLPQAPLLPQGFWWEFFARAEAAGLRVVEVPVEHRRRDGGRTQIYRPGRLPRIALTHLVGLVKLRRELRRAQAEGGAVQLPPASVVKPR